MVIKNKEDIVRFSTKLDLLSVVAIFSVNWITPPIIKVRAYKSTREILEISSNSENKCLYCLENMSVYSEDTEVINLIKEYLSGGFTQELVLNNYWLGDQVVCQPISRK